MPLKSKPSPASLTPPSSSSSCPESADPCYSFPTSSSFSPTFFRKCPPTHPHQGTYTRRRPYPIVPTRKQLTPPFTPSSDAHPKHRIYTTEVAFDSHYDRPLFRKSATADNIQTMRNSNNNNNSMGLLWGRWWRPCSADSTIGGGGNLPRNVSTESVMSTSISSGSLSSLASEAMGTGLGNMVSTVATVATSALVALPFRVLGASRQDPIPPTSLLAPMLSSCSSGAEVQPTRTIPTTTTTTSNPSTAMPNSSAIAAATMATPPSLRSLDDGRPRPDDDDGDVAKQKAAPTNFPTVLTPLLLLRPASTAAVSLVTAPVRFAFNTALSMATEAKHTTTAWGAGLIRQAVPFPVPGWFPSLVAANPSSTQQPQQQSTQ